MHRHTYMVRIRLCFFLHGVDVQSKKQITAILNSPSLDHQLNCASSWQSGLSVPYSGLKKNHITSTQNIRAGESVGLVPRSTRGWWSTPRCAVIGEPAAWATDTHFDKSPALGFTWLPIWRIPAGTECCATRPWLHSPPLPSLYCISHNPLS